MWSLSLSRERSEGNSGVLLTAKDFGFIVINSC